jgi:hypothetical protein
VAESAIEVATEPARWLLAAGIDGVPLTEKHALARTVVREGADRWPAWWAAEVHGPPHRESDVAVLAALHQGLKRLRLMQRRGRKLLTTARGRGLAADPRALLDVLATDVGRYDPFSAEVADAVIAALRDVDSLDGEAVDDIAEICALRGRWRSADGRLPDAQARSWALLDLRCSGEAYGLIRWEWARTRSSGRIALTPAGRIVFGGSTAVDPSMPVLVFNAELLNVPKVSAQLAVGSQQPLTALHDAIQDAFGWEDDHLYSFWTSGRFWDGVESEFTSPVHADEVDARTADVPIAELELAVGSVLAYIFDFGDEWRVRLELERIEEPDDHPYPRVLERTGQAPPQYDV